jgi:hypothetical protein
MIVQDLKLITSSPILFWMSREFLKKERNRRLFLESSGFEASKLKE